MWKQIWEHFRLVLRLDNALLRFERRLLPGATADESGTE
jgi:hypothetical protein